MFSSLAGKTAENYGLKGGRCILISGVLLLLSCGRVHPPAVGDVPIPPPDIPHLNAQVTVVDDGSGGADIVGLYASFEYDSGNQPHIAYYDFSNGDLKYAVRSGGQFAVTVVDSAGDVGAYCSLKIDTNDNPHIAYYDRSYGRVKYAWLNGSGQWEITVLDSPDIEVGDPGLWISLDINTNDMPWIYVSYINKQLYDLRYLRWTKFGSPEISRWVDQGVGSGYSQVGGVINGKTSIALDYNAFPTIIYYDASNGDLKMARYDPVGYSGYPVWYIEQVKKLRTREFIEGFFLDQASGMYRAFLQFPSTQDKSETTVKRFTGTFQSAGILQRSEYDYVDSRTIEIPDTVYRSNYEFSIDYPRADVYIDEDDYLSQTYLAEDWDEGYWNDLVIEPPPNERKNICYYNADLGDLYYGRWDQAGYEGYEGEAWTLETVDRGGFVGAYCSIGLRRPADRYLPVIAYYDIAGHQLRFAAREEGRWQPYIVDTGDALTGIGVHAGAWASLDVADDHTVGTALQDVDNNILLFAEIEYP